MSKWERYLEKDDLRLTGKCSCSRRQDDNPIVYRSEETIEGRPIEIDAVRIGHRSSYRIALSHWAAEQDSLRKIHR